MLKYQLMSPVTILFLILYCGNLLAASSFSAGYQQIYVDAGEMSNAIPVSVWYPSEEKSQPTQFGPFEMDIANRAMSAKGLYPLVLISHGTGGTHLGHRDTALYLAKRGYIVAALLHPKDNYQDNSNAGTQQNWVDRPGHLKKVIDYMLQKSDFNGVIDKREVVVVGHSMGGYTALALAGGRINPKFCQDLEKSPVACKGKTTKMNGDKTLDEFYDARVTALVLLAPVGFLFDFSSLGEIKLPTYLLYAEKDAILSFDKNAKPIIDAMVSQGKFSSAAISGAGHFSFITPFPKSLADSVGEAAKDPNGFDRAEMHTQFNPKIYEFLVKSRLTP